VAISVASGVDAVFSLLPAAALAYKLVTELALVLLLCFLNLRGMHNRSGSCCQSFWASSLPISS
jgi:hypothetical protein